MLRDISLHIMDLCENSIKAGADKIEVMITVDTQKDIFTVIISDNGSGMSSEMLSKVYDPFTTGRTTRHVGLGIPFFKLACEMTGGNISIVSEPLKGTVLQGQMVLSHIDRIPLGDLGETFVALILAKPDNIYTLKLVSGSKEEEISTEDIIRGLDGVPITALAVLNWVKDYVNNRVKNIFGDKFS